jgi:hypothetical protein
MQPVAVLADHLGQPEHYDHPGSLFGKISALDRAELGRVRGGGYLVDAGLRGVPDGFGILLHIEGPNVDWQGGTRETGELDYHGPAYSSRSSFLVDLCILLWWFFRCVCESVLLCLYYCSFRRWKLRCLAPLLE